MTFPRVFANLTSPVPLSYLDDNFNQLSTGSTSTVSLSGAALVDYIQAGTGAVSRSVQAKLQEWVSITDFGAVADATLIAGVIGGTNNRAAIQAAIDSLPAKGGTVFIPKGAYAFGGSGIFIDTEHVKLVGEGMASDEGAGTSLLGSSMLCYSGSATAINVATQGGAGWSFGTTLAGTELKDFALIGTASATAGIQIGTASSSVFPIRVKMDSVSIFNFAGAGVSGLKINYLVTGLFERVYAYNNTDGIFVAGGTTMNFRNIISRVNGRYGVHITNTTNSVSSLSIESQSVIESNTDSGLLVLTAGTTNGTVAVRDTHFENNCVSSGTYQCLVGPSSGSSVTAILIVDGCRFITTNQTGDLSIDYVNKATVSNTQFDSSGGKIPLKLVSTNAAGVVIDTCRTLGGTIDPDALATVVINSVTGAGASYTGTLTGGTTSPTATVYYRKLWDVVTVDVPAFTATSNATTKTITGMPAQIRPATAKRGLYIASDNGGASVAGLFELGTNGVLTLYATVAGGAWTASGTFLSDKFQFTYTMN